MTDGATPNTTAKTTSEGGDRMSKNDLRMVLALARKCKTLEEFILALLEIIG